MHCIASEKYPTGLMPLTLVFVVDDEPRITETLVQILRMRDYEAVGFTDPLLALAATADAKPALLLSDYMMPEMNGLSLAEQVVEQCPDCKVLMITGTISHAQNHPAAGRFEILQKPVSPLDLLEKIAAKLGNPLKKS